MKTESIKIRILIPLALALSLLLGGFVFISYKSMKTELSREMDRKIKTFEANYEGHLDYEIKKLSVALKSIISNGEIKRSFLEKDREELFRQSSPLFERLKTEDGITHFYFTGPDRINFLRVHQPKRYGDSIDRFTMLEAEKTGIGSHGVELGPLGTLTIRAVEPWYDGERHIGYVELGVELGHVLEEIQELMDIKIYAFINKKFLDREGWEAGIRMLERKESWYLFPDTVPLGEFPEDVPELVADKMAHRYRVSRSALIEASLKGKHYRTSYMPLVDDIGREVGHVAVLHNTTNMVSNFRKTTFLVSLISITIGGTLFLLFYIIIGKVEKRLETSNRELIHQSNHDHLTGLPNRKLFSDRLNQTILHSERNEQSVALLYIDLDNFKNINDTLGHPIGDILLVKVARRLQKNLRKGTTVSRLGGDEFAITDEDISGQMGASYVARRIANLFDEAFLLNGQEIFVSTSIGIAIYPADGKNPHTLLKNADTAMYHAKKLGKNNYQFFSTKMNVEMEKRMLIETKLRRALEKDEFTLYYQPKVDLDKGIVVGMEALIRWHYNGTDLIPPADFIPVAEETSLILNIDRWVLYTACKQLKIWREAGHENQQVSVNISGLHFKQGRILKTVNTVLKETGLNPHCLELFNQLRRRFSNFIPYSYHPQKLVHFCKQHNCFTFGLIATDFFFR